jgi:hypothetical protein
MKPLLRLEGRNMEHVHELFIPGTRTWNEHLVIGSFVPHDAEEILKIRPGARMREDVSARAYEKSGCFSVRSCYRALKDEHDQKDAMARNMSDSLENSQWWKALWRVNIPPKIRIFW